MSYIDVPVETEPVELAGVAFEYLEDKVEGWLPAPGNLEAWLIEALAQIASELLVLTGQVPDAIFAYYGESIVGIPPYQAVPATGSTTWTAVDAGGYTITAGTLLAITAAGASDGYAFEVVADFEFPAGSQTAAGVQIRALDAGAAQSGLTGTVELIDPYDFVSSVTLDGPTSGGADAEASDAYLDRLSNLFTLLTPRPILPQDFAVLAQSTVPAVARATAIDLYNPGPPIDTNCPRCVTVAVVDANGNALSALDKQAVDDLLQSQREVNFLVFVVDPTYTQIDVAATVKVYPGYDPAAVAAQADAAIAAYLSPASWGVPPFGDTSGRSWLNDTVVRYLELAEQLNRVDGVWYVVMPTLLFGPHGGTQGIADVALAGVAPLPKPGTIAVTGQA